jgi:hypothetical protein
VRHKRRTRSHVIDDLSFNHLERFVLLCGWSAQRERPDYSIDVKIRTYDQRGEVQMGYILVQLKGTDTLVFNSQRTVVSCRIDRRDVAFWVRNPFPVILVRYDARNDQAYWVHIQDYFASGGGLEHEQTGQTLTVHIPGANRVDCEAIAEFGRLLAERVSFYQG